ncbi:hypothetical protein V8C42DRAFT_317482 [Trichoderma barbatum]
MVGIHSCFHSEERPSSRAQVSMRLLYSSIRCPQLQFARAMFHIVTARRLKHCTNHAAALDRADANQSIPAGMPERAGIQTSGIANKPQTADTLTLRPRDVYHSIHHIAV